MCSVAYALYRQVAMSVFLHVIRHNTCVMYNSLRKLHALALTERIRSVQDADSGTLLQLLYLQIRPGYDMELKKDRYAS